MDTSLQVALKKYSAMLDKAFAAADRMFADQRSEDGNAVLGLILTGWELFKMQDDVLSLTRKKAQRDLGKAADNLPENPGPAYFSGVTPAFVRALTRKDFEYIPKRTHDEIQELVMRKNKQLVSEARMGCLAGCIFREAGSGRVEGR